MIFKNIFTILISFFLISYSATAQITIVFGNQTGASGDSFGDTSDVVEIMGDISGVDNRASSSQLSTALAGTSLSSTWTAGTTLSTANDASLVTFDIVFADYNGNETEGLNDQADGLGVQGGGGNNAIDNYYVGGNPNFTNQDSTLTNTEGYLEWISLKLENVTGLAAGEQLVFTTMDTLFGSAAPANTEYYRLDIGAFGSAPAASTNAPFSGTGTISANVTRFDINNAAFTIGAGIKTGGTDTTSSFILNNVVIDVVPVPEANNFALLSSLVVTGLLAVRRRR